MPRLRTPAPGRARMSLFDDSTWRGDHFEVLFPLLRPGGWYVIEDRAWDLPDSFQDNLRTRHTSVRHAVWLVAPVTEPETGQAPLRRGLISGVRGGT